MKPFSQLRQELKEAVPASTLNQSITTPNPGEKVVGGNTIRPNQLSAPKPDSGWGNVKNLKPKPTTLASVGKSALGAAGRLASKYSPHATALATGYEAGKELNKISAVNRVTDSAGKYIANKLQGMGIGKSPEVVKAKSPTVSVKPASTEPKTTVAAQTGGGLVSFPKSASSEKSSTDAKPTTKSPLPKETAGKMTSSGSTTHSPAKNSSGGNPKVIAKGRAPKMTPSVTPKALPAKRIEADPNLGPNKVGVTARAFGTKSNITSTQNRFGQGQKSTFLAPTPRKDIMQGAKSIPKAAVSGSAPTTAVGSKPPPLDRSTAKKM